MNDLWAKQQSLFHSISRSLDNFKQIGKNNYSAAKIRSRVTSLKDLWAQCINGHTALLQGFPEDKRDAVPYFRDQLFDKHEDIYQDTLDYMAESLEEVEPSVSHVQPSSRACKQGDSTSSALSHLPPIKIPPFSGNYDEWETFRDRFTSLIIVNKDLTAFARMHFLASSLTGRALDSIKSIPVTADNFEIAWKTLVSRYENKRRLIEVHVSALHNLPTVSRENALELNELRDKANRAIASLRNLGRSPDDILNDILVYRVSQQLDYATRKAWKLKGSDDSTIPTYANLDSFIASRARALEELNPINAVKIARSTKLTSATASTSTTVICPLCNDAHFINKCSKFTKRSPSQRLEIIKHANRCLNCLSSKHAVHSCPSKYSCRTCQKRHHSMLHVDSALPSIGSANFKNASSTSDASDPAAVTAMCSTTIPSRPSVLLATARVQVSSSDGRTATVRALLDQGSEMTFITARLSNILKLQRFRMPISISAVGGVDAGCCQWAASIRISSVGKSTPVFTITASILKSLTKYSPASTVSYIDWTHLTDLTLADPDPLGSGAIDILIGSDLYGELLLDGIRKGAIGQPTAQNTILGWVLFGPTSATNSSGYTTTVKHCFNSSSLDRELRRFWEIEEIPRHSILSPEEQKCEAHFLATHSRDSEGRYIVRLPFKKGPPIEIGESYNVALRLVNVLHRRMKNNLALRTEYIAFMDEYEQLGHMKRVPHVAGQSQCVYVPHHPVIRENSLTTHLRVVFNASSLTTNSTSLNDHLLIGPKLQSDLAAVVLRWRQFRYVYCADITKMYRQIRVDSRDLDYQRILWMDKNNESVQAYQLLTVTYGTTPAPFLALRVIRQLLKDEGEAFPMAVPILQDHMYVDDLLFGADDIPLLKQARAQVCELLSRGKFDLRKWSSNSSALLDDIAGENHGLACSKDLKLDESLKVLGLSWNPSLDSFQFRASLPNAPSNTKRLILSTIARLFDPLGWSAPVTVTAKIFLQRLWQLKLDWDEILPSHLLNQWDLIRSSLADLHDLRVNRWINRGHDTVHCELHGFADASTAAYAACVYMRLQSVSGEVTSMLLIGKSKVAPVKSLSIPRLELAAAVLLTRVMEFVRSTLNLTTVPCHCWTDSTVVLTWVSQHPSKWKTFVSNRVSDIQSRLPGASWRHVCTDDNPADCASRGIPGNKLSAHHLWWHGPAWLRLPVSEWPAQLLSVTLDHSLERNLRAITNLAQSTEPWDLASRYSSWPKLIRVTAYVLRFVARLRSSAKRRAEFDEVPSVLSHDECQSAKTFWVKRIQDELFPVERAALLKKKSISSKSSILSLNPFLGEDGLLRVGGRLSNAPIPFKTKHPVLLAAHPLVKLIVRHAHVQSMHAGTQLTLSILRQTYWVVRARSVIKAVIHRCLICTRERAVIPTQLMGHLPSVRVSPPARAFLHCGLDYAGPVHIRSMSGRGIASRKAYIAVFVCMAVRAVHLELVESYSTAAFLGAYSRFCARRGLPESVYSDNGTTFVGADRELTSAFRASLRDPNFLNNEAVKNISWHFIPPSAPHFGGLWEAGVRSVKHHLRRVVGSHTLTFEEFSTLLCNIEACLNSRPLAPLTDAIDDYEPLTPAHFLIGSALTARPEPSLLNVNENRLSRWQVVRHQTEKFWKLWQNDYVNTLQQRVKWRMETKPNVKVGQLVLLRNSLLPPCRWELGRIIEYHAGLDGLVRVVTVKTAASEYKRPIVNLCLLPIDIEETDPSI